MPPPTAQSWTQLTLLFSALLTVFFATATSRAQVVLDPGDIASFSQADNCTSGTDIPNGVESLARASSSCDAATRSLTAQVRPISGPGWVGFQVTRAFATLTNDFEVSADPGTEGNTVAAWVSYDVDWNGRILLLGFLSKPSVEVSIRLIDLTDGGKAIEGEMIWARDDDAVGFSIPYVPVLSFNIGGGRDTNTASSTFSAVLKRGHRYRIAVHLECAVFSDGGLDIGTECDYEDNFLIGNSGGGAGWSAMSVKLGLDEAVILEQLEKLTDHSHVYLTGRGRGHNKVQAETGPALLPDGTVGDDVDGVPNPDDRCPSTPPDQAVDADGCSLGEFCALHRSASSCVSADWNDDAQKNPKDCRWRRQVCEAR